MNKPRLSLRHIVRHDMDAASGGGTTPPVRPAESVPVSYSLDEADAGRSPTDANGGMTADLDIRKRLRKADFVSLPLGIVGTNCMNCRHIDTSENQAVCRQKKLDGQQVNMRNCCAYWDAQGVIRSWHQ